MGTARDDGSLRFSTTFGGNEERRRLLRLYGVTIVESPGDRVFVYHSGGISGVVGMAAVRSGNGFKLDDEKQSGNLAAKTFDQIDDRPGGPAGGTTRRPLETGGRAPRRRPPVGRLFA